MNTLDWLETCVKSKQEKGKTEWQQGYQNAMIDFLFLINEARGIQHDNTIRIACNAYCLGKLKDPTEGKFFSETFKSK